MCPQFYRGECLKPKIIILVSYKTYQCRALFILTNTRHFFDLPMPNTFWQRQQRMLALRDIGLMYRKNSDRSHQTSNSTTKGISFADNQTTNTLLFYTT